MPQEEADLIDSQSTLWKKLKTTQWVDLEGQQDPQGCLPSSSHPHHEAGLRDASASFLLYSLGLESGQSKSESGINLLLFIITDPSWSIPFT